jgi:hypothetical protein
MLLSPCPVSVPATFASFEAGKPKKVAPDRRYAKAAHDPERDDADEHDVATDPQSSAIVSGGMA